MDRALAVDTSRIQEMRELFQGQYACIVDLFIRDTTLYLDQIACALQGGDREEILSIAHKLKSSAAELGFERMRSIAHAMEHCHNEPFERLGVHYEALRTAYAFSVPFL